MKVPFLDLNAAYEELKPEIDAAVARVLSSGRYILGEEVEAFEAEFADYVSAEHCIGVGNGFDALALSLKALDIGPGDEVLVPAHTFIATWMAVSDVGATPVPVDVDEQTYTIDPALLEPAITERTRAIIPVHLYGHPANLDPILNIARQYGLAVVEDAAQAHGARYKGQRVGAHGDLVTWSFYPGKNLGAMGDAGGVTTDQPKLAQRLRRLRNYGSSQKYVHEVQGRNSRLDPLQAAILRVKLAHLDEWNRRRKAIASQYHQAFKATGLQLPTVANWAEHAWHLYVVRHEQRDLVADRLAEEGVETMVHYPIPPQQQRAYALSADAISEPTRDLTKTILSLPVHPHLTSQNNVINKLDKIIKAGSKR